MEEQTQVSLRSLINRVYQNNKFLDTWYSGRVNSVIAAFKKTQKDSNNRLFLSFMAPQGYKVVTLEDLQMDDVDYVKCIEQNFFYGQPIFASMFVMPMTLDLKNEVTLVNERYELLLFTLETDLMRQRTIYIKTGQPGSEYYELHEEFSNNLILPAVINRMGSIIQTRSLKILN